jgi:hypothetical protein
MSFSQIPAKFNFDLYFDIFIFCQFCIFFSFFQVRTGFILQFCSGGYCIKLLVVFVSNLMDHDSADRATSYYQSRYKKSQDFDPQLPSQTQ